MSHGVTPCSAQGPAEAASCSEKGCWELEMGQHKLSYDPVKKLLQRSYKSATGCATATQRARGEQGCSPVCQHSAVHGGRTDKHADTAAVSEQLQLGVQCSVQPCGKSTSVFTR